MVKNRNFGSALVKRLCSLSLVFLVGCSSPSLTEPYKALLTQKEHCFELAKSGGDVFPQSEWLSNLSKEQQRVVLSYLAQYAYNQCIGEQVRALKQSVLQQSKDIQTFFNEYVGLHELNGEMPTDVDRQALLTIQDQIQMPFVSNDVYESL
ncbi:Lipoprotein [Vibrio neptunius]